MHEEKLPNAYIYFLSLTWFYYRRYNPPDWRMTRRGLADANANSLAHKNTWDTGMRFGGVSSIIPEVYYPLNIYLYCFSCLYNTIFQQKNTSFYSLPPKQNGHYQSALKYKNYILLISYKLICFILTVIYICFEIKHSTKPDNIMPLWVLVSNLSWCIIHFNSHRAIKIKLQLQFSRCRSVNK